LCGKIRTSHVLRAAERNTHHASRFTRIALCHHLSSAIFNPRDEIRENVGKVIVGKGDVVDLALVALLCEGHILFEDVPGSARRRWQRRSRVRSTARSAAFNSRLIYSQAT